jgi:hypothetical protein
VDKSFRKLLLAFKLLARRVLLVVYKTSQGLLLNLSETRCGMA